ncbi:MAG: divalent cation tolerance protein CutA [Minisyncoccia bacterium]
MTHYQVFISAETKEGATKILDALLEKKLVLGGPILEGPAKFWWKGKIVEMSYANLLTYTIEKLKDEVTRVATEASEEEVPMISFIPFEGNPELLKLIDDTLG